MWVSSLMAIVLLAVTPTLERTAVAQAAETVLGAQGLSQAEVGQIKSTIQQWATALADKDYEQWEGLWAQDGVLVMPGQGRVVGRANVAEAARSHFRLVSSFTFTDWAVVGRDDLAVTLSTITLDAEIRNVTASLIIVLRKGGEQWLVQAVMFEKAPHGG